MSRARRVVKGLEEGIEAVSESKLGKTVRRAVRGDEPKRTPKDLAVAKAKPPKVEKSLAAKPTGGKPAATAPAKPKTEKPFAAKTEGEKSLAVPSKQNEPRKAVISDVRDVGLGQQKYVTPEGAWLTVMENAKFAPRQHSVTDFVVPEELRGQGLGGALLDEVLAKYPLDSLSAAISSEPSVRAFYKRGFRPLGNPQGSLDDALAIMRDDSSVSMGVPRTPQGIIAYHGSPHSFDRFDISKIGTGEGAQAYGHGLYFAEAEPVAQEYRQRLAEVTAAPFDEIGIPPREWNAATMFARQMDPSQPDVAARDFAQWVGRQVTPELVDAFRVAKKPGNMYKVRLNVRPEDLLDWDAAFTPEGLESFAAKFDRVNPATRQRLEDWSYVSQKRGLPMPEGSDVMQQLGGGRVSSPELSRMLNEAGILGVQYLDQASRSVGDGTRNYVMFNDDTIDLLRKYAKGGSV